MDETVANGVVETSKKPTSPEDFDDSDISEGGWSAFDDDPSESQPDKKPYPKPTEPGKNDGLNDGGASSRPRDGPPNVTNSFKFDEDDDLPRPAPIRTSSQKDLGVSNESGVGREAVQPFTTEIEVAPADPGPAVRPKGMQGWGWGGAGWGLDKVGGVFKQVAGDVKGLTSSLQQAFVEEEGGEGVVEDEIDWAENSKREGVLRRLQGEDTLEQGLKAIDDQVEQLALGVGRAFGSFWGATTKGAQSLALKVESVAKTATKEIVESVEELDAVRKAQSGFKAAAAQTSAVGGFIADRAEKGLESVGRKALAFLDGDDWEVRRMDQNSVVHEEQVSFDSSFYIYGGQEHFEELEGLCNAWAKKCNKSRASMPDPDRQILDGAITSLHPIFEVEGSPSESEDEDGSVRSVDQKLIPSYSLVRALTSGSVEEAASMAQTAVKKLYERVDRPVESPDSEPGTPPSSRPNLTVDMDVATGEGRESLERMHEEGIKRLAELCACCVKSLVEVGQSVQGENEGRKEREREGGEEEDQGWPEDYQMTSQLLRGYVVRLVHDIEAVAGGFVEALLGVSTSYNEMLGDGSIGQKGASLASDLEVDARTAVNRVKDGFRNLMYVVLGTLITSEQAEVT